MKIQNTKPILLTIILLMIIPGCNQSKIDVYQRLIHHANSVKVINTHEHQRHPKDLGYNKSNFWTLLNHSYLMSDFISAGGTFYNANQIDTISLNQFWEKNGDFLNYAANTSYYQHFIKGINICYGLSETNFTKEGIEQLSFQIEKNYNNYDEWFNECFQKANFETMLIDQFWDNHNLDVNNKYFTLIFPVNKLVYDAAPAKLVYTDKDKHFQKFIQYSGTDKLNTIDDYLAFVDFMLQSAMEKGAVGLKNSMAYGRSIDYEDVSYDKAKVLFEQSPQLAPEEKKALEDFVFHWILEKAAEYNLPIQIHTGYLAGNGNQLDNGQPVKLNNLFLQHPDTKFDLFHGGFPWTGEFTALGKMFPNVYLDLVWLPQISKQRALVTFNEILDCVPYNKILWGGDCQFIEESVGSLEFGKQVLCEVLAKRISKGQLTEENAKRIITAVLRDNAKSLFDI